MLAAYFAVSTGYAQSVDDRYEFHINGGALGPVMANIHEITGFQLLFSHDLVGFEGVNAVNGQYTVEEAMEILLRDTGLTSGLTESGMIVITRENSANAQDRGDEMAVAKVKKSVLASVAALVFGVGAQAQVVELVDEAHEVEEQLEEIVVTGSHIRGVETVGASSITFTREEISNTGYSTVEELFESLPQNLDEISADGALATGASRVALGNSEGASSISLRGLGPGSTLVLLNGKRRPGNIRGAAVDVSAIPLSMIERVEVVTGAASAVYGSDAVAGVVNIATVTELDGAESQIYYGEASAGGERFNFSQTFGRTFENGGFVLGYDYRKDQELDATATGVLRVPSPNGITPIPNLYFLRRPAEQHVGLVAGHYDLSDNVELYGDAQFSSDKNDSTLVFGFAGLFDIGGVSVTESDQYSATAGVRLDVGNDWQIDLSAVHGVVDNVSPFVNLFAGFGTITSDDAQLTEQDEDEAKLTSFSMIADGPLGSIGNGTISSALGVEFRDESFVRTRFALPAHTPVPLEAEDRDREIWSVFGEVHLPLINRSGQQLELSLAGRYEDYSDFGDTFNPQIGIEWAPMDVLTLRGSYSEAFRAPNLFTMGFGIQTQVQTVDDPLTPGNTATVFVETGGNPDLLPEEANTYSLGIDWEPSDRTRLSLTYFNIEYEGRIDQPAPTSGLTALQDEALFPGLVNRTPSAVDVSDSLSRSSVIINNTGVPFDPAVGDPFVVFSNLVTFDNRRNNIGLESIDGVDFQASSTVETSLGNWSFGLNGTYYLDFTRNFTATSPTIEQLNQPGKTVDLRVRGRVGWSRSSWNVNTYVNYVNGYDDTLAATPIEIDSWTTVDLILRYDASEIADRGFASGLRVTLGIDNVFDEDPPVFLNNAIGLGYDPANADPIGRFVFLRLSKSW